MSTDELAQKLFHAYASAPPNPWLTHDGKTVPLWNELNDIVRGKWVAAAKEARALLEPQPRKAPAGPPPPPPPPPGRTVG